MREQRALYVRRKMAARRSPGCPAAESVAGLLAEVVDAVDRVHLDVAHVDAL
jgi:hypothetical protein